MAELGQGWFGFNLTPDELTTHLLRLGELLAEAGRQRADVEVYVAPRGRLEEKSLDRYRELGVDQLILPLFGRSADSFAERADALAAQTLG